MKKKVVSIMLTTAMAVGLLAGCGGDAKEPAKEESKEEAKEETDAAGSSNASGAEDAETVLKWAC